MNKKILVPALVLWIVSTVYGFLTCGWLFNWVYQLPPIIWKTNAEIISTTNMLGSLAVGLLSSLVFCYVYAFFYKGLPYTGSKKGLAYAFIIWLIGPFTGMLSMPFYMTINPLVVAYWISSVLIIFLIMGAILGKMYKPGN